MLWNVRLLGGSKRRLTDIDGDSLRGVFTDGNSAAYSQQGNIYVVRSDGTGAHKLVSAGNDVCQIVWSPDGGAIRFTMKDRIWEVSSNGSGLHKVIPGWHGLSANCCGRWTSDGNFFLFLSDGQIWALDERRGLLGKPPDDPIQLTEGPIHWGDRRATTCLVVRGRTIRSKDGRKIFALGPHPAVSFPGSIQRPNSSSLFSGAFLPKASSSPKTASRSLMFPTPKAPCGRQTGMGAIPCN